MNPGQHKVDQRLTKLHRARNRREQAQRSRAGHQASRASGKRPQSAVPASRQKVRGREQAPGDQPKTSSTRSTKRSSSKSRRRPRSALASLRTPSARPGTFSGSENAILEKENEPTASAGVRKLSSRRPNSAYASTMHNVYGGGGGEEDKETRSAAVRSRAPQKSVAVRKRKERAKRESSRRPKSALARSSAKAGAKASRARADEKAKDKGHGAEEEPTTQDAIASRVRSEIDLVRVYAGAREAEEMEARWKAGESVIPIRRRPKSAHVTRAVAREVVAAPLEDAILEDHAHGKGGSSRGRKARPRSAVPTGTRRQNSRSRSRSRPRPQSSRPRSRSRPRPR